MVKCFHLSQMQALKAFNCLRSCWTCIYLEMELLCVVLVVLEVAATIATTYYTS